jgi:hypothetical protein
MADPPDPPVITRWLPGRLVTNYQVKQDISRTVTKPFCFSITQAG